MIFLVSSFAYYEFLINGHIPCIQFLVHIMDITVPIPYSFVLLLFPMSPHEYENLYFETQTKNRENSAKPVTDNSLFPVYALI